MPPRPGRVLPFPPPRRSAPPGGTTPTPTSAGLVATMSIDASEVARLVARDLADEVLPQSSVGVQSLTHLHARVWALLEHHSTLVDKAHAP